jgi:hypothetical protein
LTRYDRSAVITRLAWIFSLGVGGGVPQRYSRALPSAEGISRANRAPMFAVVVAKQVQADDMRN